MAFLQAAANRGSISTGYEIDNSVKNEPDNGERFDTGDKFTNYSSVRKFTVSAWLKRTELSVQSIIWFNVNTATSINLQFEAGDYLSIVFQDNVGNGVESYAKTSALFRDTSAWYHVILAVDTTQGTAANRTKIYVNGVNQTLEQGNGYYDTFPAQNYDVPLQTRHYLLGYDGGNNGFRGYAAEYYFLDGITASLTDLGEFDEDSGIWKPIEYTGGFGNEGYYLNFEDASALGKDVSSNNQGNFSHYGGSAADQATDSPTNNFCTINTPFDPYVGAHPTISEGATLMTGGSSGQQDSYGTIALFKGKWYFEFSILNIGGLAIYNMFGGVVKVDRLLQSSYNNAANGHHSHDGGWGGNCYAVGHHNNTSGGFTSVSGATVDTVIGVAVDMDNGKIWWSSQGTWASSGGTASNPATGSLPQFTNLLTQYPGEPVVPAYNHYVHQSTTQGAFNFGGYQDHAFTDIGTNSDANGYGSFAYTPPSGYYAICSKNLAEYG